MSRLIELIKKIKYEFKDEGLLIRALTHSSYKKKVQNYEKLEFLGDRVLGLIISKKIFLTFQNDSEGNLAKKLSLLVCKDTLVKISDKVNLKDHLKTSKEISNSSLKSIKANSMEALIGAIFLDSDLHAVEKVILRLWKDEIEKIDLSNHDPKSRLQEWCLRKRKKLPIYRCISKKGPEHDPEFTFSVAFDEEFFATGKGKNKQDAEINAASILLKQIEK
ncbi:MAG: ribonuclease III [Pelagibacteraceae bacterium TMED65]|nr:ribonuclease III [Rickettsiales bacterium]OUU52770.1 MAG: ribonuclease III [Pelagibacteraceae bacterium TMED65]